MRTLTGMLIVVALLAVGAQARMVEGIATFSGAWTGGGFARTGTMVARDAAGLELLRLTVPLLFGGGAAPYAVEVPDSTETLSLVFWGVLRQRVTLPVDTLAPVDWAMMAGDIDGSGQVNARDILFARYYAARPQPDRRGDVNGDGVTNQADVDICKGASLQGQADPE